MKKSLAALLLLSLAAVGVSAATYPDGPVKIIVPYSAGGGLR